MKYNFVYKIINIEKYLTPIVMEVTNLGLTMKPEYPLPSGGSIPTGFNCNNFKPGISEREEREWGSGEGF